MPVSQVIGSEIVGDQKRRFDGCHFNNINALSASPDGENFISVDSQCINLWNIDNSTTAYSLVDLSQDPNRDDSDEITYAEYHPNRADLLAYSSNRGYAVLQDMRESTIFEK